MAAPPTTVLKPRRGRRIALLLCGVFVSVIGIGAITSGAWLPGIVAAAFGLWAVVLFGARLFVPHAYQTEITGEGFRAYDSFGRVQHDVPWAEVRRFKPVTGNAPLRPGGDILVGFDLVDPPARHRRLGGKDADGTLPDPYTGYDPVVQEMLRYAEAASPAEQRLASPNDFTVF